MSTDLRQLFDPETATFTYLLFDPAGREAILIDPVRDQLERDERLLDELGLDLVWTLETHVHADHVTSSGVLRMRRGSRSVVSSRGGPGCADRRVDHGERLSLGAIELEVRATPGHTDGCVTYVEHGARRAFTGDTLLVRGTGRTDFQHGDARVLYRSIHTQIFTLPEGYRLYPGHDYRGFTCTTVAEEKQHNPRVGEGRSEDDFVQIMAGLGLAYPARIDEAVPANLRCGVPPAARVDGALVEGSRDAWAPITRRQGVPEADVDWLAAQRGGLRVVDVRRDDEWAAGHLEDAEHVVLDRLTDTAAAWDRDAPLALICRSGQRSGRGAMALEDLGFRRVVSVAGGMLAWEARGLPVTGS